MEYMTIIDLSHHISPAIPVYPGTEPPTFVAANTIERNGFAEMKISMYTHTGTHMDAPSHILRDGKSLDMFDIGHFMGGAVVVNALQISGEITVDRLEPYLKQLESADFALIKTGWSHYWGQDRYFEGFPTLSVDAAEWLAGLHLKGVAVDAISIDPIGNAALPAHYALLARDTLIIENLTHLDAIRDEEVYFICLPLRIDGADGSPARAVAVGE
jgi:arylformamidase